MPSDFTPKISSEVIVGFQDNILDQLDQVSYHFTFFMMSENDIINNDADPELGLVFDSSKRTVIVESGRTANYLIDDVTIMNILGPGREQRTSTAYSFEFTIFEPGGVSLLDTIYNTSLDLGISNYCKCTYFFEVTFRARSEPDSIPQVLNRAWVWPILIVSIETSITAAGATYKFKATLNSQAASSEQYGMTKTNIEIAGATLGDSMQDLEDHLNKEAGELVYTYRQHNVADQYEININPVIGGYTYVDPGKVNKSNESTASMDPNIANNNASVGSSTNEPIQITKFIDTILSASPDYMKYLKNTVSDGSQESDPSSNVTKKLHRILVRTEMLQYDSMRADYAHKYIYDILPYEIGTLQCTADELKKSKTGTERYSVYKEFRWLQKHYQYIFTGMNDQILNLDLNFNLAWFARVPMTTSTGNADPNDNVNGGYDSRLINQPQPGVEKKIPQKSSTLVPSLPPQTGGSQPSPEMVKEFQEYVEANPKSGIAADPQDKKDSEFAIKMYKKYGLTDTESGAVYEAMDVARRFKAEGNAMGYDEYDTTLKSKYPPTSMANPPQPAVEPKATKTEPPPTPTPPPGGLSGGGLESGAADILPNNTAGNMTQSNITYVSTVQHFDDDATKGKAKPTSYLVTVIPPELQDTNTGTSSQPDSGRKYVEYMFAQAFSAKSGDLVNLTITIKGDPYWLSPAPFQLEPSGMTMIKRSYDPTDFSPDNYNANGISYQNYLLLTLRTPSEADEETGFIDVVKTSEVFSGVYGVIYVANKFNNGLFTQELECIIEPLISYSDTQEVDG